MPRTLHLLTRSADPLSERVIRKQCETTETTAGVEIKVVDLTGPAPDYRAVLEAIFAAESVAVW
ncbi:MAG: hypothetical protein H7A45_07755 [Verrucomicrobiales bacterium]|nr:hypothetical protein [Verrucomicrobiales bacterium]MCP5527123.1 hypothetical protein [Verrucomicrobiales bacterium]